MKFQLTLDKIRNDEKLKEKIYIAIAILSALGFIIYLFRHVLFGAGVAPGSDVSSFAHTTKYMVDYWLKYHHLPATDNSWYVGFELLYAPPLVNLFMGIIYFFVHNAELTSRIFEPMGLFLLFLTTFWVLKKEKFSTLAAWLGGMLWIFTPVVFRYSIDSSTKLVALIFLPFAFYFTNKILESGQTKYFVYLSLIMAITVYGHPMNGMALAGSLFIYSLIYAFFDRKISAFKFYLIVAGFFLGFMLASQYLIPFLLERAVVSGVVSKPGDIPSGFSSSLIAIGINFPFFLLVLPVVWRKRQAKTAAIFLTGVITTVVSFGYYWGLSTFFPFSQIYYYVWLFTAAFCLIYLYGQGADIIETKRFVSSLFKYAVIIAFSLAFFNLSARNALMLNGLKTIPLINGPNDQALVDTLNQNPNPGRIYMARNPFGYTNWILSEGTNKKSVEGHYYAVARMGRHLALMTDAINNRYFDYTINKMKYFNVRYFLGNQKLGVIKDHKERYVGQEFMNYLSKTYNKILQTSGTLSETFPVYSLFYKDEPSSYLVPVQAKVLAIGKYSSTVSQALSPKLEVMEGGSIYLDDYDPEFLKNFDTVILYGFSCRNKNKAESIAKEYAESGGNLVIDLFNSGVSPLSETPNFLGVSSVPQKLVGQEGLVKVENDAALDDLLPTQFDLSGEVIEESGLLKYVPVNEWNALEYTSLDKSLLKLSSDSDFLSALGYKKIGNAKVTFVGLNFFYHLYLNHDPIELDLFTKIAAPDFHLENNRPVINQTEFQPNNLRFDVESASGQLYLVSMSYSDHWQAYLDGERVKTTNIEDLIAVEIPAGNHVLEVKYRPTAISFWGDIISLLALAVLISIFIFWRGRVVH